MLASAAACSKKDPAPGPASADGSQLEVDPQIEGFLAAASEGDLAVVRAMVRKGMDPDEADAGGNTALLRAAAAGRQNVVRYLVEDAGADIDQESELGYTPLMNAIGSGFTNVAHYLIGKGADPDHAASFDGLTPLIMASRTGSLSTMAALLDAGASVNRADKAGNTPLINATLMNHPAAVKGLLDRRADVNALTNQSRNSALGIACIWGYEEIAEILLDHGASSDVREATTGMTPLGAAASNGHTGIIRLLKLFMANVSVPDRAGNTPLHNAARRGHAEAVRVLLEFGANPNTPNNLGITPVLAAGDAGWTEIRDLLIEAGGKPWDGQGRRWKPFTGSVAGFATPQSWEVFDPFTSQSPFREGISFLPPLEDSEPDTTSRLLIRPIDVANETQVFYINGESSYWSVRFEDRMRELSGNPRARRVAENETASNDGVIFSVVGFEVAPEDPAGKAGFFAVALATYRDRMIIIDVGGHPSENSPASVAADLIRAMTVASGRNPANP